MASSPFEIEQQASPLSPGDRAKLADFFLESLQGPAMVEVEQEWEKEIVFRVEAYENGETFTFPTEAVFAETMRLS